MTHKNRDKKIEYKAFNFEVKDLNLDTGTFVGYSAVFGNVDHGRDMVEKGSFARTLNNRGNAPYPILFAHAFRDPAIGSASLSEDNYGLLTKGQLFIDRMEKAKDVFLNMKEKVSNSMSFMYDVIQASEEVISGEVVRVLKELKVYEVSLLNTGFGMNEMAGVISLKEGEVEVREQEKRIKKLEDMLQELKSKATDTDFRTKIERDIETLHQKVVELGQGHSKATFAPDELVKLQSAVKSLTDQIKADLKN